MGKNHLRVLSILKEVEVVFIHDQDESCIQGIDSKGAPFVVNPDGWLEKVDAVIIATPSITHFDYIAKCAPIVKHIFVEKPMATNLEEATKIAALQDKYGFKLMVGFIERYNPAIIAVKKLTTEHKVVSLDLTRTNKLSARITDVDVILDLMIHDVDLAMHINGPIKHVQAHGQAKNGIIGFANANITHHNGSFSRLQASRITEKKQRNLSVTCEALYIDCDLLRKEIVLTRGSKIVDEPTQPYKIQAIQEQVSVKLEEALLLELQDFIKMINTPDFTSYPDFAAGLKANEVCELIRGQIAISH